MEGQFKILIDEGNKDLWEDLEKQYNIDIKEGGPGYLTSFKEDKVTIEVDMEDLNPACFTHELLHLYIKQQQVLIAEDLKDRVEKSKSVNKLFSDSLKEHLGNCLEHHKMLPIYLKRGYKNEDFVRDFDIKVMEEKEVEELENNFLHGGIYNRDAVDKLIGKFYSMKTSNNPQYNYDKIYVGLQRIDVHLYKALEELWEEWQNFSVGESKEKYRAMLDNFVINLENWKSDKVVL